MKYEGDFFSSALRADSSALRASMRCRRQREIPVPGQIQYPGYATELTFSLRGLIIVFLSDDVYNEGTLHAQSN